MTKLPEAAGAGARRLALRLTARTEETMKRILLICALLTASYTVAQAPGPEVSAAASTTSAAAGSDLVSNGVSQTPVDENKAVLNARDYGVTCSGTTDDTKAMQNAINAACTFGTTPKTLILPNRCAVKLSSTLMITHCAGLTIDGGQSQGEASLGGGTATFLWYGTTGVPMITLNQTRDSIFKNFSMFPNASSNQLNGASGCLLIDAIVPVTGIVTNNSFEDLQCSNGSANSRFIGFDICPTAPGNCEAQNFDRITIGCSYHKPTSITSNGVGIGYEGKAGAEPYFEHIHWIEETYCSKGIDVEGGTGTNVLDIDGGLMGGNYTDLFLNAGRNTSWRHIRSENAIAQFVIGTSSGSGAHDLTIEENSFSGLTNGTTTISYSYHTTGGIIRLVKNDWDFNSTVIPFGPTGNGAFVGVLDSQDNTYPNNVNCITTAFAFSGVMYSSLNDQPTGGSCNYGGMHLGRPTGSLRIDPTAFGNLPTCASRTQGMLKPVSDSKTDIWGTTITGGGSDHVLAYCDGTNWTVAGK
jgi:hypothetical protein